MRTVTVEIKVKLTIDMDEGVEVADIINELDYTFADTTTQAYVKDANIIDFEVTDSR
jgi:hypothetical protein